MGYMGKLFCKGLILIGLLCFGKTGLAQPSYHTYQDQVFSFDGSFAFDQENNVLQSSQVGGLTFLVPDIDAEALSPPIAISSKSASDYTALAAELALAGEGDFSLSIQFGNPTSNDWLPFQELTRCQPYGDSLGQWRSDLLFAPDGFSHYRFLIRLPSPTGSTTLAIDELRMHKIRIDGLPQPDTITVELQGTPAACEGCLPSFHPREAWGAPDPDSQRHTCAQPLYAPVSHMIVQHSATENMSSNWGAVMLALWNYDVEVLGSCDLTYNWYIDPEGGIYEGRGGGYTVVGDYFCGNEVGTVGICLLGTYENVSPSNEALHSLRRLLAWQACAADLDPMASKHLLAGPLPDPIPVISSLSAGCADECEPAMLAQKLPQIRQDVQQRLSNPNACLVSLTETPEGMTPFTLYPNPSQGAVHIRMESARPQAADVAVLDVQGRIIHFQQIQLTVGRQDIPLNLPNCTAGLYYVRVKTSTMQQTSLLQMAK